MSTETVQKDTVVSMEYTLHVDDEEIDSSNGQDPLQFLVGHGNIISGLEREMMGMMPTQFTNSLSNTASNDFPDFESIIFNTFDGDMGSRR